jgi:hypothetical protein
MLHSICGMTAAGGIFIEGKSLPESFWFEFQTSFWGCLGLYQGVCWLDLFTLLLLLGLSL